MIRAIVVIRTSTSRQEIDAQKREIIDYANTFGFSDDEIEVVGARGASAIKLDETYMRNLQVIYKLVETNKIECVFAWALDRIGRDEVTMVALKNYLIDHKVQLKVKNPTLYLLNEDGSVNTGMELAISLFITMAKQEMKTKKARFMRAKKDYASKGKFIGARYMMFGYTTDSNGYLVINPETADIVKMIYDMYCTHKHSATTISKELNERGYRINGRKFNEGHIVNILKNTAYIGHCDRNSLVKDYPRIITDEQFEEVKQIRNSRNSSLDKSTKHISLALKVLKCLDCGSNYMRYQSGTDIRYVCYKKQQGRRYEKNERCTESCYVQVAPMDTVLEDLSYTLKAANQVCLNQTQIKEMEQKKVILQQKVDNAESELANIKDKFAKVLDAWTNDIIDKKQYDTRIEKLKAEQSNLNVSLTTFKNELFNLELTLSRKDDNTIDDQENVLLDIAKTVGETDLRALKTQIDKYIKVAYAKAIKVNGTALTVIMVADFDNNLYNYIFQQKHGKKQGLFTYNLKENSLNVYNHPRRMLTGLFNHNLEPEKGIGNAMKTIIDDANLMTDLYKKVTDLNKKVYAKLQ